MARACFRSASVGGLDEERARGEREAALVVSVPSDPMTDVAEDEPLGSLEAELLSVLWSRGGWLSAPEAHEALAAQRPIAYTTVSTVLIRLWQKGHLERIRDGRAFAYRAVRTKEQHAAARMAGLLADLEDRPRALSWFLEFLDADERAQLRRLLKRAASER